MSKTMTRLLGLSALSSLALLNAACASVRRGPADVTGRFGHPSGMNVEIRADGTFSLQDSPSLGTPPTVQGRWKIVEPYGLILSNTYQQPDGYPIRMSHSDEHEDIRVRVENWRDGSPLEGMGVRIDCVNVSNRGITDQNGIARIPRCPSASRRFLFVDLQHGARKDVEARWEIQDAAMNEIAVKVDPCVEFFITDQLWLIRGDKLYIFWDPFPLERRK